jgi:LPS export ABC transporter protein LptC
MVNLKMSLFDNFSSMAGVFTRHTCESNSEFLLSHVCLVGTPATGRKNPFLLLFLASCLLISACEEDKKDIKKQEYKGPISEVYGINMAYTDSARLVVKMSTEAQLTMANEDKKYPKEVRVFFFDKFGNNTTKLRGDSAVYIHATNLYRIMGRVQINNQVKNEVLETDELFWNPNTKKIYSNKAVDIKTPEQTIHGVGMDSNQDFTEYTIRRISNSQVSVKNLPQ